MKCSVVKVPQAFLYETYEAAEGDKKGCDGGITDEVFYGWKIYILKEKRNIVYVRTFYGYEGYMKKKELEKSNYNDEKDLFLAVVTAPSVDVLKTNRVQGKIVSSLPRGSIVTGYGSADDKGYQTVCLVDGKKGYVPAVHIKRFSFLQEKFNMTEQEEENLRDKIVQTAESYLGTIYRWGGKSAMGIDCSGLAFMSYFLNGILIYRDAKIKKKYPIKEISKDRIKKGDLIYFPGHVAIYMGNHKFIHATGKKENFGCVYGSFFEEDAEYREDLKNTIVKCGSYFKEKKSNLQKKIGE